MLDNVVITVAITALTNSIALIQSNTSHDQPFNLASRLGSQAYVDVLVPLDKPWDGTGTTFPLFIIAFLCTSRRR